MKDMPARSSPPERVPRGDRDLGCDRPHILAVARNLIAQPLESLVSNWNWKAGLLSGIFRAAVFSAGVIPREPAALGGVAIQLVYRIAVGGLWGSLAQAFRDAQPAWPAGLCFTAVLPAAVHLVEYALLRAGHASHIRAGMIASVALSAISLLLNWGLMRKGLLLTDKGTDSLASDLARLPAVLGDFLIAGPRRLARALRGCLA